MDVREKLVELIGSTEYGNGSLVGKNFQKGFIEKIASNLIGNGVTVQDWISVKDRLPEEDIRVLVFTKEYIYGLGKMDTDRLHNNRWVRWNGCVTHWMPLPQPPKGE